MKIAAIVMQRANSNNNSGSCFWHVFVHISGMREFACASRERCDKIPSSLKQ